MDWWAASGIYLMDYFRETIEFYWGDFCSKDFKSQYLRIYACDPSFLEMDEIKKWNQIFALHMYMSYELYMS